MKNKDVLISKKKELNSKLPLMKLRSALDTIPKQKE